MTDDGIDFIPGLVDPLILEIFLNSNNYKDRLLISDLKKKARLVKFGDFEENSFFVRVDEVDEILHTKFLRDLKEFDTLSDTSLASNVTSIYFIDSMIRDFKSLRYFKIYVSNSQNYTRKVENRIVFDYRIMHSKIDLANKCIPEFRKQCEEIFSKLGIYRCETFFEKPYFEISAKDLFSKLIHYSSSLDQDDEEQITIMEILTIFGPKLEKDNSILLVIMQK